LVLAPQVRLLPATVCGFLLNSLSLRGLGRLTPQTLRLKLGSLRGISGLAASISLCLAVDDDSTETSLKGNLGVRPDRASTAEPVDGELKASASKLLLGDDG
jgi:hypothetical protein